MCQVWIDTWVGVCRQCHTINNYLSTMNKEASNLGSGVMNYFLSVCVVYIHKHGLVHIFMWWCSPQIIRPSVDGLCRNGPSEISRDPHTNRLQTQPKRLGWL